MDIIRALMVLLGLFMWQSLDVLIVSGNAVFKVEHKYKGGKVNRTLEEIRTRDVQRHGRMLGTVDLPLGGNGQPSSVGLYFTKIQIGNPPKDYHVQVDTGSDLLWVNCEGCTQCPRGSRLGITLNRYDPRGSSAVKLVNCGDSQCTMMHNGFLPGCESDILCPYEVHYGDDSASSGYYVQDTLTYNQASGESQKSANSTIVFGCGVRQSGQLSKPADALDGLIGFGQAQSSVLSQLAASGKVPKMFSHCLDNVKGGGIFSIGQLVEPKLNVTPLIPNKPHYNVVMKSIEVDDEVIDSYSDDSGNDREVIIDSGTTLAYLPHDIYKKIVNTIFSKHLDLHLHTLQDQFTCFMYSGKLNDGFPPVTFRFANNLNLKVLPHEYFFQLNGDYQWCVGWMSSELSSPDGKDVTILGDLVLSNRVVFYDLENQTIGWTEHDCSSSIKVKDGSSRAVYDVAASNISSANSLICSRSLIILIMLINMFLFIQH